MRLYESLRNLEENSYQQGVMTKGRKRNDSSLMRMKIHVGLQAT
jgi:hypothetical protein